MTFDLKIISLVKFSLFGNWIRLIEKRLRKISNVVIHYPNYSLHENVVILDSVYVWRDCIYLANENTDQQILSTSLSNKKCFSVKQLCLHITFYSENDFIWCFIKYFVYCLKIFIVLRNIGVSNTYLCNSNKSTHF